ESAFELRHDVLFVRSQRFERDSISRGAANCRRAAYHHVSDRLRGRFGGVTRNVFDACGQDTLIDQLQLVVSPAKRFDSHVQMTRSLPPSIGTCAPVILANSGPHISAASSATSRLATSTPSTLRRLYCSMLKP